MTHMTGPTGKVATLLLVALVLFHGAIAQSLKEDEQHLINFLDNVFPNYSSLFNTSVPTCQWPGLACIGLGLHQRITELTLVGLGLHGSIPNDTLGALTSLEKLDLSDNLLSGDIPMDIFGLSNLSVLGLAGNRLMGTLPDSVANLAQLRTLNVSMNLLSGSLPSELGDLRSLIVLDVHGNNFRGTFPTLFSNTFLLSLDLSSNQLSGEVPYVFGSLRKLQSLNLSRNMLTGEVQWKFQSLGSLWSIDLSENDFNGALPSITSQQLKTFSVSSNGFNGSIPSSLTSLPNLQCLSMGNNRLSGPLPPLPWGSSIRLLDCSNNSLSGSIPENLLALSNLAIVRLGMNNFTGPIPANVTPQLQELDLQQNQFSGNIPPNISSLPALQELDLSSNQLVGRIPFGLVELNSLQHLGLAHNGFDEDNFPDFTPMVNLMFLNLSSCNIGGLIPESFGNFSNLMQLDLSHNHLNGSIPRAMCQAANLTSLNLSYNNLTGNIPPDMDSLTNLSHVDLAYNDLSGNVPDGNLWSTFNDSSFEGNPLLCGRVVNVPCSNGRYPPHSPYSRRHYRRHLRAAAVVGIVMGVAIAFCAILTAVLILSKRKRKPRKLPAKEVSKYLSGPVTFEADPSSWAVQVPQPGLIPVIMFEKPLLNLTFADLLQATSGFHKDNQIADGGYGPVYKGVLPGGLQIVVKVLFEGGPENEYEKAAQLEALGKIRHPNLVSLVGYCLVGEERLLVYEFMENGDLQRRLHELPEGTHNPDDWSKDTWEHPDAETMRHDELSWHVRHRIALGIARALAFLHHGCQPNLVHRDVNSCNILLDSQYEAHLADCGLAGLMDCEKRSDTPMIGGAVGYVPPEYGQMWKATTRGDVYSFGVVLLELVTGKRPTGHYFHDSYGGNLVGWVRALIREKRGYKCLDPSLLSTGVESEMLETLRIGYLCTAELPSKRPTMQQIVGLLKDIQPDFTSL